MIGQSRNEAVLKPNLWITGVPKAGTSSLFIALEQHPLISGTTPKETFYMLDPDSVLLNQGSNFWKDGIAGWKHLFKDERGSPRYRLDGTTHLFFQERCPDVLQQHYAGSKFIIMLREPSERIYSSFVYTRDTLLRIPRDISFAQYVNDIFAGRPLNYVHDPVSCFVLSRELLYSEYRRFLERWYSSIDRSMIFVGLFEEFVEEQKLFMERLFNFLELEPMEIPKVHGNPSRSFKYRALHKTLANVAASVPMHRTLKKIAKKVYLNRFAKAPESITNKDMAAKRKLKDYFEDSSRDLQASFGIDISRWYAG